MIVNGIEYPDEKADPYSYRPDAGLSGFDRPGDDTDSRSYHQGPPPPAYNDLNRASAYPSSSSAYAEGRQYPTSYPQGAYAGPMYTGDRSSQGFYADAARGDPCASGQDYNRGPYGSSSNHAPTSAYLPQSAPYASPYSTDRPTPSQDTLYPSYPDSKSPRVGLSRDTVYDQSSPYLPPDQPSGSYTASSRSPQVRPSATSGQSGGSGVMGKLTGGSVASLLDPPPPAFLRAPPPNLSYAPFGPSALMSSSGDLAAGFLLIAPPSMARPHPFATHDVKEDDWLRFLRDIRASGALSPVNRIVANIAPMALNMSFGLGILMTRGLEKRMKNKKGGAAGELVDYWNHHFFNPRRMVVVLARGRTSYSGPDVPPPDTAQYPYRSARANSSRDDSDSGTSSDSSSDSATGSHRRDRRRKRREEKRKRREDKRMKHRSRERSSGDEHEKWRLVIAFK